MEEVDQPKNISINMPQEMMAGVYSNFANVAHSDYEFSITFARVEHGEGDSNGIVVSRVNASPRFIKELIAALQDNYSKWETKEEIRNLPEEDTSSASA